MLAGKTPGRPIEFSIPVKLAPFVKDPGQMKSAAGSLAWIPCMRKRLQVSSLGLIPFQKIRTSHFDD